MHHFVRKSDVLEQNRHYFCNEQPKINKKQVLDLFTNTNYGHWLLVPFICRRDGFRRFDPDVRVPLSWRKHDDFIQELINTCQQVTAVFRFISYVMKHLQEPKAHSVRPQFS